MNQMNKISSAWEMNQNYAVQAKLSADTIEKYWTEYEAVSSRVNIPPYVIGVIHFRESSFDFTTHLANGDPLFNAQNEPIATSHMPSGLGPYTSWREGAVGALKHEGFDQGYHWDLCNALDNLERYNGLGYRELGIMSPYVWAGTLSYQKGLFVADGKFDELKVDLRPGCALILLELLKRGHDLNFRPIA